MQLTKISVKLGRTHNLGDYENERPEILYEAALEPGDNPEAVREQLRAMAKADVDEACDQALEAKNKAPEYWTGPRFDAVYVKEDKYMAIVPHKAELPGVWNWESRRCIGWRKPKLLDYLAENFRDWTVQSFIDGDYSDLPNLFEFTLLYFNRYDTGYVVLLPDLDRFDDLPAPWQYAQRFYFTRFLGGMLSHAAGMAADKGATFVNLLDGDLSKLPVIAEPGPEPNMEEPIEEDWDDEDYQDGDDYEEDED